MSWIDERVEQRRRLAERNKALAEGAEVLFNNLWEEITAQAKEAQEKSVAVGTTNARARDRRVALAFLIIPRLGPERYWAQKSAGSGRKAETSSTAPAPSCGVPAGRRGSPWAG
jgi:hypothetical protein